ncbi:MAG: hypothetical protein HSCHL_0699 [Hydrogenibacillus schlegelii]|uniref:CobQ/CobB/MinD/ParA nucleotide binding domain-containing protein n=1 Tax=Hydrogenibacillus schlegelii TaxID=1484 RepID=A0A2T5G7U9_HYDSH|nr:hypothetical protein [Hydrogenibacillus schlegelii]PTQ52228.1 MAG: hypothetical protein HSCHL_0699 [Hydrogenibacillus schlegelii]
MRIITEAIHLVFAPGPGEALEKRLRRLGFRVFRDVNILLFAAGIADVRANIALIQAETPGVSGEEVVAAVRKVRLSRPDLRLIFVYGERNPALIAELIGLGVYDHHVAEEFDEDDVLAWLRTPMTYADAHALLEGVPPPRPASVPEKAPRMREEAEAPRAGVFRENRRAPVPSVEDVREEPGRRSAPRAEKPQKDRRKRRWFSLFGIFRPKRKDEPVSAADEEEEAETGDLDAIFGDLSEESPVPFDAKTTSPSRTAEAPPGQAESGPAAFSGPRPEPPVRASGFVVGIYSGAKGSTGKTTISLALTAYLADRVGSVALVDADRASLGASILLFDGPIVQPRRSRILHGAALYPPETLDGVFPDADVIVLDFGAVLTERDREILRRADLVLVVTLPETATVSIIRRHLQASGVRNARLVLNRHVPGEGLPPWEVARAMNLPLLETIPFDLRSLEEAGIRKINVIDVPGNKFRDPIMKIGDRIRMEIPQKGVHAR